MDEEKICEECKIEFDDEVSKETLENLSNNKGDDE